MDLTAHALPAVQIRLNSVSNEGLFTLDAETVFHLYLHPHCIGVTEICHMALPTHALRAMQVGTKSVGNEGHFTPEAKQFFVRISPKIAVGSLRNTMW
jgi:hypothetical protein